MKTIKSAHAEKAALDWLVWKATGGIDAYPQTASGKGFLKIWKGNSSKYVHPTGWYGKPRGESMLTHRRHPAKVF